MTVVVVVVVEEDLGRKFYKSLGLKTLREIYDTCPWNPLWSVDLSKSYLITPFTSSSVDFTP